MPQLYFNIRHRDEVVEDPGGAEYPSLTEARLDAIKSARELMAEGILAGKLSRQRTFDITDASGNIVLVVPFADAIEEE